AASANCGPITLHGPHQGAQKSTSTGNWPRPIWAAKWSTPRVTGLPSNRACPHFPQVGASDNLAAGTRLGAWQWGHTTSSGSGLVAGDGELMRGPPLAPANAAGCSRAMESRPG